MLRETDPGKDRLQDGVRWISRVLGCAVLAVALVISLHWWFRPHALRDYRTDLRESATARLGQTVYFGQQGGGQESALHKTLHIDLRSVRPHIALNTSNAEVKILLCAIGGDPIGVSTDAGPSCASVTNFRSGDVVLGWDRGKTDVIIAITPHRAGQVRVDGLDETYQDGVRRGHQHTGFEVTVNSSAA